MYITMQQTRHKWMHGELQYSQLIWSFRTSRILLAPDKELDDGMELLEPKH